ncbi:hypothetical protein FNV62_43680 [Streptomyces sp. RLB3-17]|uniref:hypothetical protein n=1 Tax=unclassified Streptomyces TaxID=2593676 RepID=UPI0011626D18|nr:MULTISPECIES: hypothetical protein [unclassified Streptomyces]QDO02207.1 hypothetical protein FNV58_45275 [Streptomyces sp. RLB1-9]QDO23942.1 hypothetical protein FNV65_43860 [Streptomyces sp. S1A1-8]QDO34066.1 hypothetical protein FNV63_43885 [Streptomyces sp. S1A1-3]QDO44072.1 hypothetical protein FNV62_43680 [Streptomyces sp. RLB3-17]
MSSRYEYEDAGSAFGQMRRVASNGQFAKVQRAHRAYIDHRRLCDVCAVESPQCATAQSLWEMYREANSS